MKMNGFFLLYFAVCGTFFSFQVSPEVADQIAQKIWQNECGGKLEHLTHWNKGEDFPSFGIGHFIWYPKGKQDRFQETFPELLKFLQSEGIEIPSWLEKGCPWKTREAFYRDTESPRMVSLRKLLFCTKSLQARFIAKRLEQTISQMGERNEKIARALAADPRGLYALIDYLNFKGSGLLPAETYKGQGWGLLQVLSRLSPSSNDIVADFASAAKAILIERVRNSPPERHEEQWLPGWLKRVSSYLNCIP